MADEQTPQKSPPTARKDRVRLTILLYRKPGMSRSDFQHYWREEHSAIFSSVAIVKKNLLNYEQVGEKSFFALQSFGPRLHGLSQKGGLIVLFFSQPVSADACQ